VESGGITRNNVTVILAVPPPGLIAIMDCWPIHVSEKVLMNI